MSLASTMMAIALSLQIITSFLLTTTTALSPQGFTTDLIHRRSKADAQLESSPYANIVLDSSEYLMKLQVGTPPVEIEVILDTGSDLTWTQCLPCLNCYDQDAPIFDPSKSSTYKDKTCDTPNHSCPYEIIYAGGSYSTGTYATETLTIQSTSGQPFVMAETTIGCGHNNSGFSSTYSGIVGLDWGSSSLISQMGDRFLGLFSYCFSSKETSKINFGTNALVAGDGTVSTTLFRKNDKPYYYLNLEAMSVNETRIETLGTSFHASDGNIIIDSGTTYTFLPETYCNQVKDAVKNVMKFELTPVSVAGDLLCYNTGDIENFPAITMHFSDGADLVLDKYNMYKQMGIMSCMMINCVDSTQYAIFGNRAQNNLLIGYDTSSELVSFKPTDCSALWS